MKNDKKIFDLIYRDLDGELNSEEQEKLREIIEKNPEMAVFRAEWQKVRSQFDKEKEQEIKTDLKQSILERINMEKYKQKETGKELKLSTPLWRRPAFRISLVFVLGVFTGFLLFTFLKVDLSGSKVPTPEMKGTLYDTRSFDNMKVADNILFDTPLAKAVFAVRYSTRIVEIRIDLSSLYPVKTVIQFDYNNFECLNVQNVTVNDQTSCSSSFNFVQINNVGDNKFIIQLYNKNNLQHNIDFTILQNDMPIYQNSVAVNKE
jgi:hypothetical protein